jgi:hypothetical protein
VTIVLPQLKSEFIRYAAEEDQSEVKLRNCNDWERILLQQHVTVDPISILESYRANQEICLGVGAKQVGESVAFSWTIADREVNLVRIAKVGVGKVPKTNQHDTISTGKVFAIHSVLYVFRTVIGQEWKQDNQEITVCLNNSQTSQLLLPICTKPRSTIQDGN